MEIAVLEFVRFAEEDVAEEGLEGRGGAFDAASEVLVVGADEGVAKEPGVFGEGLVGDVLEAELAEVFGGKDGGGAGVAFAEGMDLPETGDEGGEVGDERGLVARWIAILALVAEVPVERGGDFGEGRVVDGLAVEHPFLLREIDGAEFPGEGEHAREDTAVEAEVVFGGEAERGLGEDGVDVRRSVVRLSVSLGIGPGWLLLVVLSDNASGVLGGNISFDVAPGRLDKIGRNLQAVDLLQPDGDTPVLRALAAAGLLGDEILGERGRRGRGRRGRAGGGREMEGGAGGHGEELVRAAVRRARAEEKVVMNEA